MSANILVQTTEAASQTAADDVPEVRKNADAQTDLMDVNTDLSPPPKMEERAL